MAKQQRVKKAKAVTAAIPSTRNYLRKTAVVMVAALCVSIGFAAYAGNAPFHGHVSITRHLSPSRANASPPVDATKSTEPAVRDQTAPSLVDKYGEAAKSPAIANEIRNIEAKAPSEAAVAAADRYEALLNGHPMPGMDPTSLLMAGYVPPGMDPYTASILSRSLPKLPRTPRTGPFTPEQIDQMAGMPPDPQNAALTSLGTDRAQIDAANQAMFERYVREEHGPLAIPPMHVDHNWLADHATKTPTGYVVKKDYDGSIREMTNSSGSIVSEYSYDPWGTPTQIAGSGPTPDFLFQGMYYHQRSNLYLTRYRAYSPILGRFLSRDPIGERGGTNLYAFVGNNPVNRRDPSGLYWFQSPATPYVPFMPGNIAPYGGQQALYNPNQTPLPNTQAGEAPACFNYSLPPGGGNRVPPGWGPIPWGAPVQYGDVILYGTLTGYGPAYAHSATVFGSDSGIATSVQQVVGPGEPVSYANPSDPNSTPFQPLQVIRNYGGEGGMFPQNVVIPGVSTVSPYSP